MTQEIIVYRSPIETNFYDCLEQYPMAIVYFIGGAALLILALWAWGKFQNRKRKRGYGVW